MFWNLRKRWPNLMSSRRDFLQSATLLSAAAAVPMSTVLSACSSEGSGGASADDGIQTAWLEITGRLRDPSRTNTFGAYTMSDPGIWMGKEGTHVPGAALQQNGTVLATSMHPQGPLDETTGTKDGHYILCHFVESEDEEIFDLVMYTRNFAIPDVKAELYVPPSYRGELRVYQYCTEHDLWYTTVTKS